MIERLVGVLTGSLIDGGLVWGLVELWDGEIVGTAEEVGIRAEVDMKSWFGGLRLLGVELVGEGGNFVPSGGTCVRLGFGGGEKFGVSHMKLF